MHEGQFINVCKLKSIFELISQLSYFCNLHVYLDYVEWFVILGVVMMN